MKRFLCVLALTAITVLPVSAVAAAEAAAGPTAKQAQTLVTESALSRHTRKIAKQMRCLVCQGETVAVSQSGFAEDVRQKIRELLKKGWSDEQIFDYFVDRYGHYILYQPPFKMSTWALWFGPLIMLVFGLVCLFVYLRARARVTATNTLSPEEAKRARQLLGEAEESRR